MTGLTRTRALAYQIAEHAPAALTRHRALLLAQQLTASPAALTPGMLRQIVIAIRALTSPGWLAAHADHAAVSGFTHLDTLSAPPPLPVLDHILARCLETRFGPAAHATPPGPDSKATALG
ncbi:MAG TPA: hypothetical protein VGH27_02550 [Streptosporangiaceae bacterium]|jgi:hypothetical protein